MSTERVAGSMLAAIGLGLLLTNGASPAPAVDVPAVEALVEVDRLAAGVTDDRHIRGEVAHLLERPLDADAAVRIALLNNGRIHGRLRDLGAYEGRLIQAGRIANPTFEAELLPERNSMVELRLEYDLTSLVLAPLKARVAAAERDAARLEAAAAVLQLGYDVRAEFYDFQAAEQRLIVARQSLEAFATSRDAAAALLNAGNIPALEASTQIAAYESARVTVAEIELAVEEQREQLQRLLGLHGEATTWRRAADLPPAPEDTPPLVEIETRALEASLELETIRRRLEGLARRTGLSRVQGWLPEITVDFHSLSGNPEEERQESGWRFGGGASISVPLFDRKQGQTRAYEAEFDSLRHDYHALAVEIRSAAREARNRLVSAHARARQYEQVITPARRAVMEQTLLQYNAMQVGVFTLLEARRAQLDDQLGYIDRLRDFWTATAAVDALLAGKRVATTRRSANPAAWTAVADEGGH